MNGLSCAWRSRFSHSLFVSVLSVEEIELASDDSGSAGSTVPAGLVFDLPHASMDNLWSNLFYPAALKSKVMAHAGAALMASQSGYDADVIGCNRLVLLHGPPGTGQDSSALRSFGLILFAATLADVCAASGLLFLVSPQAKPLSARPSLTSSPFALDASSCSLIQSVALRSCTPPQPLLLPLRLAPLPNVVSWRSTAIRSSPSISRRVASSFTPCSTRSSTQRGIRICIISC